ncbi:MAG: selenocysteine lyase/cysteine desulfurase [Spirosomataceae bacterium]|jgi:selenocysteine lyase/cysteine desulfurase
MLSCQKEFFNLDPTAHYLNNAAYGPLPKQSAEAANIGIRSKINPQLMVSSDHFTFAERIRELSKTLLNAEDPHRIAIIPSVSYGMATVAANLHRLPNIRQKTHLLSLENEFPNDTYAFERVCKELNLTNRYVEKPVSANTGEDWNKELLTAISEETAAIVIPHVHWIYGTIFDLEEIGRKCRECGALLIIDGTQSVGALPLDIELIQPDALILGAYKWLLGPYSLGLGYFGSFFDDGIPLEETWMNRTNSEDFSGLTNLTSSYRPMAQRYNMGEFSQFIQLPMLEESLKLLLQWGVENIQEYARELTRQPIIELRELGCKIEQDTYRAGHLFGLELPEETDNQLLHDLLIQQKIFVSKRGDGLRVSVNIFNDASDLQALIEVIKQATGFTK